MKKKIIALGAGMVGRTIAVDLSQNYDVTSVDISQGNLDLLSRFSTIKTKQADLSDAQTIKKVVADADLVIGAMPGFMGFNMLKATLEAQKDIVDISFFPEDPFQLDLLAKNNNTTAVVDCGVAPGMDNIILGYHHKKMKVERFVCMVGGLPLERKLPWQYKAPFSPIDVIAEYTRPARLVENGKIVVRPALSDSEFINFENVGALEAFNTDGLRTLLNLDIPYMVEKTLRYPGHIDSIRILRDSGFFSQDAIDLNGIKVKPMEATEKILFPQWKYEDGEEDFTVMRVIAEGVEHNQNVRYTYNLYDRYNRESNTSSMARTTGYTASAAARLVLDGQFNQKGIIAPESLGEDASRFEYILNYLNGKGINYNLEKEICN